MFCMLYLVSVQVSYVLWMFETIKKNYLWLF